MGRCLFEFAIISIILYVLLFNYSASAHITLLVVGLGRVALGDAAVARGVDELEVILVNLGHDAHMTHTLAARTTVEEHEIAGFEFVASNATAIVDLSARSAVEAETKFLEHIASET